MSYGFYDSGRRYRRRYWVRFGKLALVLLVLGCACAFTYEVGQQQLIRRVQDLETRLAAMTAAKDALDANAAKLQTALQTAQVRLNEMQVRYDRDVPSGDLGRLKDLLAKKLTEGVDPGRIALIIEQTGSPRACTRPETKRFVVSTPLYKGPNTTVHFADGAITISGDGATSHDETGAPLAWFDTSKPVTLTFVDKDGKQTQSQGMLPMQHSVIVGDTEYRFKISPGARSFVDVVGDHCPFP